MAMGYPLKPTLANICLCYHEKMWLQNCPSDFKYVIDRRYVDDTFSLLCYKYYMAKFQKVLES